MKWCSLLATRETEVETTVRYHFIPTEMARIRKEIINEIRWGLVRIFRNWNPHTLPRVGGHFYSRGSFPKWSEVAQSCPTLCDPMDCSLPGSSIHGILQARVQEWVAISFSRGSSQPRDRTRVSCIPGRRFNRWATKGSPYGFPNPGIKPECPVSCIGRWILYHQHHLWSPKFESA